VFLSDRHNQLVCGTVRFALRIARSDIRKQDITEGQKVATGAGAAR